MRRTKKVKPLQIVPLGGVGEIGKNMCAVRYGDGILVIDTGLMFPEEEMLGVDIVIPDISYLLQNSDKIRGIVLTHGHEDHIGGIPYILKQMNKPIWGTRLTLGLVRAKLEEHNLTESSEMHEVEAGDVVEFGEISVEFVGVSHSIPDAAALAIKTPAGTVVYTSDFKFDNNPIDGRLTDISRLARLGDEGVLVLLSDCTNVEKPGYTPSERIVGYTFDDVFSQAPGRIIIATFASNVHRMQQVLDTANRYSRRVAVIGRSMARNSEIAEQLGYLKIPDGAKLSMAELSSAQPEEVVIMTTGSQGEPLSALTRMAMDEHKRIKIGPGDTIIISATPIPGNEDLVNRTINRLFRLGADVVYDPIASVHVSGHGNQEDLKLMLNLTKPQYVVPVHGEYRHIARYAQMADDMGYGSDRMLQLSVGDVLEFDQDGARISGKVDVSGSVMVDGIGVGDVSEVVLRDRWHLAQDGVIVVILTIDKAQGEIVAGPDIMSRGFVVPEHEEEIIEQAKGIIMERMSEMEVEEVAELSAVKQEVRSALGRFLNERTRRRPMIIPIVVEI
ncbi:MAG: ribonuclease J [Armatimonadetes bacterium]|nr:ribonuclease J [Armatimonadota bacterium]